MDRVLHIGQAEEDRGWRAARRSRCATRRTAAVARGEKTAPSSSSHRAPPVGCPAPGVGCRRYANADREAMDGEVSQRWPQILPGGKAVLYSSNTATIAWDGGNSHGAAASGRGSEGSVPGRHLRALCQHRPPALHPRGNLVRRAVRCRGSSFAAVQSPVVEGVLAAVNTGGAQFSIADSGTLLYVPGKSIDTELPVTWMDSDGQDDAC